MDAEHRAAVAVAEPVGSRWFVSTQTDDFAELLPLSEQLAGASRVVAITDLHVWRGQFWRLQSLVPPALRARAERLHDPRERERRLLAYALHRLMVARVLGRDPARVEIGRMASGMPMVAGLPNIATSLSHADDFVAIAVARDAGMIGVDIEAIEHESLLDGLAGSVLHPQESDRGEALIDAWVRKEAVLKAIGSGLSVDMSAFQSRQGMAVSELAMATGLRAWSLRVCANRARLGLALPTLDGLLARFEPGNVDVVSLREQVMRM
ncbi:MAG: 4'-phosphopantetheinyl transferase superfamily protein [Xanthomonadales bacterium]|nr:4'-phosphopantetheinyl transferase superfamily protein [Xanthomonadales bacterium]